MRFQGLFNINNPIPKGIFLFEDITKGVILSAQDSIRCVRNRRFERKESELEDQTSLTRDLKEGLRYHIGSNLKLLF